MANTVQAKKRARQAEKHRQHNASMRSMLRTYVKRVIKAISSGDKAKAESEYQTAVPLIDRMSGPPAASDGRFAAQDVDAVDEVTPRR